MITVVDRAATAPVTVVASKSSTLVVQSAPAQSVLTTIGRRGPPGPSVVSDDEGNIARLGSDDKILVSSVEIQEAVERNFYLSLPVQYEGGFVFPETVVFDAQLAGSVGNAETAPTEPFAVELFRNTESLGEIAWTIGGTDADFSGVSAATFASGDRLKWIPNGTGGDLFGAQVTLVGTRIY
jgi:hypothetical protein